jgi:hypothetical protein
MKALTTPTVNMLSLIKAEKSGAEVTTPILVCASIPVKCTKVVSLKP